MLSNRLPLLITGVSGVAGFVASELSPGPVAGVVVESSDPGPQPSSIMANVARQKFAAVLIDLMLDIRPSECSQNVA